MPLPGATASIVKEKITVVPTVCGEARSGEIVITVLALPTVIADELKEAALWVASPEYVPVRVYEPTSLIDQPQENGLVPPLHDAAENAPVGPLIPNVPVGVVPSALETLTETVNDSPTTTLFGTVMFIDTLVVMVTEKLVELPG